MQRHQFKIESTNTVEIKMLLSVVVINITRLLSLLRVNDTRKETGECVIEQLHCMTKECHPHNVSRSQSAIQRHNKCCPVGGRGVARIRNVSGMVVGLLSAQ